MQTADRIDNGIFIESHECWKNYQWDCSALQTKEAAPKAEHVFFMTTRFHGMH